MTTNLQRIIQSVGLSEREARIYIIGLKTGPAPASTYANKTRLNRITVYHHLEDLVSRGLFTRAVRKNVKWYEPIAPEKLSAYSQKNCETLTKALPELESLMGDTVSIPRVRYFEGTKGILDVYRETLGAKTELLNFSNSELVREFWKEYDKKYIAERVKKGIFLKGILLDTALGKKLQGQDKKHNREIRLVSAKEFPVENEIIIYDNKVAIITFGPDESDRFAVVVESEQVASTQRHIFEMTWRFAALGDSSRKEKVQKVTKKAVEEGVRKDQLEMFSM